MKEDMQYATVTSLFLIFQQLEMTVIVPWISTTFLRRHSRVSTHMVRAGLKVQDLSPLVFPSTSIGHSSVEQRFGLQSVM